MRTLAKQILWPVRGVEQSTAYHDATPDSQRTFASPFAMNVCTRGPIESRERGGSRPGLADVPQGAEVRDFHPVYETPSADVGDAPSSPSVVSKYRDRIFAAKDADWFCSRVGKYHDWDYGADYADISRACAGNIAFAGERGETITAIMPIDNGMMYVATQHTMWRLAGDPANGELQLVSREYGVVGPNAWCNANRRLLFVSHRGFVSLTYGEMPTFQSGGLPFFPTDADTILGFDAKENCCYSFSSHGSYIVDVGMDTQNPAFWPISLARPAAVGTCGGAIALKYGTAWKQFSDAVPCEAASHVAFGPIRISASDDTDGLLAELHATFGELTAAQLAVSGQGAGVGASIFTANSAERVTKIAQAAIATQGYTPPITFGHEWNCTWRPRKRGAWAVIVLSSTGKWAFEAMRAVCRQTGRLRP